MPLFFSSKVSPTITLVKNTNVGGKIEETFTALRFVLRGNYPKTYKNVYREWGWQKENY